MMDRPFRILLVGMTNDQPAMRRSLDVEDDGDTPGVQALEIDPVTLQEGDPDLPPMIDVAVFGSRVEKPLVLADRLRQRSSRTQILFLVPPENYQRFKEQLPFVPSLSDAITLESDAGTDDVTAVILESAITARRRENNQALHDRINQQLSSISILSRPHQQRPQISEQDLAAILKQTDEPILVLAPNGTTITCNDTATELFGMSDAGGKKRRLVDLFDPESRQTVGQLLSDVRAGRTVKDAEVTVLPADDEPVPAELNLSPILDEAGEIAAITAVIRDLTDRKQHEALEATMREAGDLQAVSNTLTVISDSLEHIAEQVSAGNGSIPDYLETAREATRSAAMLAHQMYIFSQRHLAEPEPVDPNEVLEMTDELLRATAGEGIEVVIDPAPEIWRIRCNPDHLETALLNLTSNAREAMPEGGQINIEVLNVTTEAEPARDGGEARMREHVVISVADSGEGMSAEVIDRAFEPFFTTRARARGLGLTQVWRFARQAEGDVRIESGVGRGTSVQLVLPRYGTLLPDEGVSPD